MQDAPYLDAFYTLSDARPSGFAGPSAIPVSEVLAFVNLTGIASMEERLKYASLIRKLDRTYLEFTREEAQKKNKSGQ